MEKEAELLREIDSPFVIEFKKVFRIDCNLYIEMEYAPRGELTKLLDVCLLCCCYSLIHFNAQEHRKNNTTISEDLIWKFFIQTALGLHGFDFSNM